MSTDRYYGKGLRTGCCKQCNERGFLYKWGGWLVCKQCIQGLCAKRDEAKRARDN